MFASKILKRDSKDVLEKWFEIIRPSENEKKAKRTVWSEQDDTKLTKLISLYGTEEKTWSTISKHMDDRTSR